MPRLLILGLLVLMNSVLSAAPQPAFVTSQACQGCHQQAFSAWRDSHHGWAWREPSAENVLGDFADARFSHEGVTYHFQREGEAFFISADGPDGAMTRYPLRYVVGVTPLQQYLVDTGKGRLQALDLAWDTERKRWFHLYPNEDTSAGNGMHWSGSYKNWNARCAECHATDFHKHYDPSRDSYASQQVEIGVGCEACHGAAEAHLDWAKAPEAFAPDRWVGVDDKGLLTPYSRNDAASEINLCAPCHARREPLSANIPPVGADFNDYYRLSLLREGMYFPDGQIQDEVYVLGSFLQSKMYARGVQCTHCHDPHSYQLKLDGNQVCTQCHNPQGNPAFPTLTKAGYDTPEHHFHAVGSEGAACTSCHMPQRYYMVVDGRRDHSFRVPRPDLTAELGTPNPCAQCHQDKDAAWAAGEIKNRFPQGQSGKPHFAHGFAQARKAPDPANDQTLMSLALDPDTPAIVRASALEHLRRSRSLDGWQRLLPLLQDSNVPVRLEALNLLKGRGAEALEKIAPLLADPVRSVRLEAAKVFLGEDPRKLEAGQRMHLAKAMNEFKQSLLAKADFPETQVVLGGVALTTRNLDAASRAFTRAVEMDPQFVNAWVMRARIAAAQGKQEALTRIINEAIEVNPENPHLKQLLEEARGNPAN